MLFPGAAIFTVLTINFVGDGLRDALDPQGKVMPLARDQGTRTTSRPMTAAAVDGVDLTVERGETVGVVGESGCGKSVTAMTVLKLVPMPPAHRRRPGAVAGARPRSIAAGEMRKIRAKEIAIVFQEPMTSLNPVYTVGEQIAETLRCTRA